MKPQGTVYAAPLLVRFGRLARRHRTLVAGFLILLVIGLVSLAVSNILIQNERRKTEREAERAGANFEKARNVVARFYVRVSENVLLDEPGMQRLRAELLTIAGEYYERFVAEAKDRPELRTEMARTIYKLAKITKDLGDNERALRQVRKGLDLVGEKDTQDKLVRGMLLNLAGEIRYTRGQYEKAKRNLI